MAVARVAVRHRYVGLSTDVKPTAPAGSTFRELDTGVVYVSNGATWYGGFDDS